jgi:hypothetical protein
MIAIYEEQDCEAEHPRCEDIPEWKRVHSFDFDAWILATQQRSSKVLVTLRVRPNGLDGEWAEVHGEVECHESDTSFLDVEEEGWCLKLPCVVPDNERTETWPGCQ